MSTFQEASHELATTKIFACCRVSTRLSQLARVPLWQMEDAAMKLFGTYLSPFTRRVAVALTSHAIPYEHNDLNGYADPVRARALNPVGKVPVLVLDDGEHLIDSMAILDYIDERVGHDQPLVPRSGP